MDLRDEIISGIGSTATTLVFSFGVLQSRKGITVRKVRTVAGIAVDEKVVARKTRAVFPGNEKIIAAVSDEIRKTT